MLQSIAQEINTDITLLYISLLINNLFSLLKENNIAIYLIGFIHSYICWVKP